MHASVDWKLYDSCGVHHVTSKDKEIFMLVEKDYPLRKGLALVMICYKLQVENFSQMANDLVLKIYEINNFTLPVKKDATARRKVKPLSRRLHCYHKSRRNFFNSDLQNSDSSVSEHGESSESIISKPMIKFVKAADCAEIKTNKAEAARKPSIKYAKMIKTKNEGTKILATVDEAGQDRKNVIKTSALLHDSTPRVTSLDADEGTQDLEISSLKARIKLLEDKDKGTTKLSGDDAPIKGRSLEIGEEADVSVPPVAKVSNVGVPTSSGLVPTVSAIFTTASVVTPYSRRPKEISAKDKAREMEEKMAREDQMMDEQITRDAEIAKMHAEEELQMVIDGLDRNNEMIAKHLHNYEQADADLTIGEKIELINELVKYQDHHAKIIKYQAQQSTPLSKKEQREFYMSVLKSHYGWKTKHFRGMTLEEIREKFIPVWKQIEDFIPMASKEEGERVKRKRLNLVQGNAKGMKMSEEVFKENLKEMMQLVLVEEVYMEALQFDREDLNQLCALVKETLSIRQASSDKEKELWVKLKRLFEPDFKEQLWTHTQALMHDPLEWRLYDICGVHHVFTKDQEIFMLVERDYPMRLEQYFLMTDYSLWEVILNGDSPVPTIVVEGVVQPVGHTSAEQKLARRNELKAHGTLLMVFPNKHHLPSKWKTHTLIWRNKADLEEQSLDDLFNSLKIYETEVKHSSSTSIEIQNLAFVSSSNIDSTTDSVSVAASVFVVCAKLLVSSLPNVDSLSNAIDVDDLQEMDLRWQMAMLTMRARRFLQKTCRNHGDNRPTSMGFDMSKVECYNCHRKGHFARECRSPKNLRRPGAADPQRRTSYQAEKEPANFALMAFFPSSSSSDKEVPSCSKACSKAYAQLHSQYDKQTDDFRKSQFDVLLNQAGLESVKARLLVYKQNESIFEENIKLLNIKVQVRDTALVILRQKLEQAEQERDDLKLKLDNFQTSSKNLTELLASQTNEKLGLAYFSSESDYESCSPSSHSDRSQSSGGYHVVPLPITGTFMPPKPNLVFHTAHIAVETDHSAFTIQLSTSKPAQDLSHTNRPSAPIIEDWPVKTSILAATPKLTSPKSNSSGKRRNRKTCFVCKSVDHLIKDCDHHTKKMAQPTHRNYADRGNNKQNASLTHKHPLKHMVPVAVLTQSKPVSNTVVRPVSADVPKFMVTRPRLTHPTITKSKSYIRRHITHSPSLKTSNSPPKITAARAPVICAAQGNMSYLSKFKELNGGYVAFGGNPKGGKISGKGKIKTSKLDFEDVYFVKELKFNPFSVSQMCDKKNNVLFTDTECLVLSSDFKLPDESQVLLRVPRKNNMYNVNLKNIVPSGDLTCLFAKATINESNLWHGRLGHINFKTINKLVKGNLVRGLPQKVFENENTCVACKKGKQHKASCKTKRVSSIDQPLFRLHMDLFRPTSVKSLNKKSYCLVVTDDYSRFT
uniref:Putative ribonuclease H-like domain-containing protein n=1 Tax=Tanacetum cinerariifolium TaxID=118510 RepID=A0A699GW95_TANCI|nr:putative ribonuclease H-like domain-containing protein [Tanacetum cinerariifolium]